MAMAAGDDDGGDNHGDGSSSDGGYGGHGTAMATMEKASAMTTTTAMTPTGKYKYPPMKQDAAVALVLEQAEALSAE